MTESERKARFCVDRHIAFIITVMERKNKIIPAEIWAKRHHDPLLVKRGNTAASSPPKCFVSLPSGQIASEHPHNSVIEHNSAVPGKTISIPAGFRILPKRCRSNYVKIAHERSVQRVINRKLRCPKGFPTRWHTNHSIKKPMDRKTIHSWECQNRRINGVKR